MMVTVIIITSVLVALAKVEGLECGQGSGMNITELQMVLNNCMYAAKNMEEEPGGDKDLKKKIDNIDYYGSDYDEDSSSAINDKSISTSKSHTDKPNTKNNHMEISTEVNNLKPSNKPKQCMFHCIFKKLKIVDDEGFPDHEKVSQNLVMNTKNNELRDFFQDTVDECFQLTQEGDNFDVCDFSLNFSKCMAEKARSNCADWPVGNTPFSDMF